MTASVPNLGFLLLLIVGAVLLIGPYFALRGRGSRAAVAGLVIGAVLAGGLALVTVFVSVSDARVRRAAMDAQVAEMEARNTEQMRRVMAQMSGQETAVEPPQQVEPPRVADPPRGPRTLRVEIPPIPEVTLHYSRGISPVVKAGALVVLIMLAYLFIDAGRKPRYTWLWRFGIAVLFFAVCGLLAGSRYAM
jgi:hypothetical protein